MRTFPGADVGSDHDLVIMNFKVRLKKINKPKNIRLKFNLDRLKEPTIAVIPSNNWWKICTSQP